MIISGYVSAKSFQRRKIEHFEDVYETYTVLEKIIRYTVPFVIAFVIEETIFRVAGTKQNGFIETVKNFLGGGYGPGSYYYPCMIQFVFFFPIIYFIIRKYKFKGLIICGGMNFIYELLQMAYGMNEECYRLLVFRYILVIAFGTYLAVTKSKARLGVSLVSFFIGAIYIVIFVYLKIKPFITIYWTETSFWACLFVLPLGHVLQKDQLHLKPIEILGKASYNIFLTQMVYYSFISGYVYRIFESRSIHLAVNFMICLVTGVLFWIIETPVTKYLIKKIKKFRIN